MGCCPRWTFLIPATLATVATLYWRLDCASSGLGALLHLVQTELEGLVLSESPIGFPWLWSGGVGALLWGSSQTTATENGRGGVPDRRRRSVYLVQVSFALALGFMALAAVFAHWVEWGRHELPPTTRTTEEAQRASVRFRWLTFGMAVLGCGCGAMGLVFLRRLVKGRRQAEDVIRRQAELLELATDSIFVCDLEKRIQYWNRGAQRLYGWTTEEALGKVAFELLATEFPIERSRLLEQLKELGHWEGQLVHTTKDRRRIVVESHWSLRRNAAGEPEAVLEINHDITERLRSEERLRGLHEQLEARVQERTRELACSNESLRISENLLRTVTNNAGVGLVMLDPQHRYLFANSTYLEMMGCEGESLVGRHVEEILGGTYPDQILPRLQRAFAGERQAFESRRMPLRGSGQERIFSVTYEPHPDASGMMQVVVVIYDITARRRAEDAVAVQTEVLERIAAAAPLPETLNKLLRLVEEQDSELKASILFLEDDGVRLRHGAAPSLPPEYLRAVDGLRIGEGAGSCGTAAWRRCPVVVENIGQDPLWADFRDLALYHGLQACWSTPIMDSVGRVLGTLAVYRRTPGRPRPDHQRLLGLATHLAAVAIIRDREESTLRQSERRFRILTETLPQLVWTCDPDGSCDFLSKQWADFTGLPSEQQLGSAWMKQVHPDDRPGLRAAWDAAVATGSEVHLEFRIRGHDGEYRWFDTRAVALRDESRQIVKWFGSNTDITERRRAEEQLRGQMARMALLNQITRAIGERQDLPSIFQVVVRDLEERMPLDLCGVCLYDSVSNLLNVTTVGVRWPVLGQNTVMVREAKIQIDPNGLTPCREGQLIHEADISRSNTEFARQLCREGIRSLVVAPLQVERQVFGVLLAARRQVGAFASQDCEFLRQLSEHVALAANQAQIYSALQQAYDDLRQTQEAVLQQERLGALGQMASGIAHDINNAISPVALYTEALLEREPNLSERARSYLGTIQRAIDDVAQTVARMREFYRQRQPQIELAAVDLNRTIRQVLDLTRVRWSDMPQERGVVVHAVTDLEKDLPVVSGVESEIRDALTNLIFNAVDAMPEGGTLTLRTRTQCLASYPDEVSVPTRVVVEVMDTGMGMDESTRRRCLEPFFTTKGERGTGLGLAMVFGMVQRHGAEIEIDSSPGQGTVARLSFKVSPATASPATLEFSANPPRQSCRILLIDDDNVLLHSLVDALEGDGHEVEMAEGGQKGIDLFRAAQARGEPFGLVLTDLGMPYVDGNKVAAAVKVDSPQTPVVMLTGWGRRMNDHELPPHVDCVLSKPPKLPEIRQAIARLVCRRSGRDRQTTFPITHVEA